MQAVSMAQLTDCGEFPTRHTHHGEVTNLSSSSQIEQCQADYTHFLVGFGGPTTNKAGGVLAGPNLEIVSVETILYLGINLRVHVRDESSTGVCMHRL
jgi:hypothetical protein